MPFDGRARLRRRSGPNLITAVLAIAGMSASFMQTIVLPIQSELPGLLNAEREQTAWVVTATLLASCIAFPIAGRLGDLYGKRRVALGLLGFLVVGSVIAALATDVVTLIVGRALQGAVMGLIPIGIAILRDVLPVERLNGGIALVSATLGFGGAIALPLSALISEFLDWHWLFWCSAALGAVNFLLVLAFVPVSTLRSPGRLDVPGAIGLAVGLAGVLLAVSQGDAWGWTSPATLGCAAGGLAVLVAWGWYQLRVDSPLVDLRVTVRPAVLFTNLSALAIGFGFFAGNIALPQILELPAGTPAGSGMGLSLLIAGLVLAPGALAAMLMAPFSAWLGKRFGGRVLVLAGPLVVAAGYAFGLLLHTEVWHILLINVLLGAGIGLSFAGMPMIIMRSVPSTETASANSINSLARALGTTSSAAVIALILSANTVTVGDGAEALALPTTNAFLLTFLVSGAAALASAGLALLVPRRPSAERRPALP